jgi:hypothetical protein
VSLRDFLAEATAPEAQLALSYLVWPEVAPDPRVVDEWVRRQGPGGYLNAVTVAVLTDRARPPSESMTRSRAAA